MKDLNDRNSEVARSSDHLQPPEPDEGKTFGDEELTTAEEYRRAIEELTEDPAAVIMPQRDAVPYGQMPVDQPFIDQRVPTEEVADLPTLFFCLLCDRPGDANLSDVRAHVLKRHTDKFARFVADYAAQSPQLPHGQTFGDDFFDQINPLDFKCRNCDAHAGPLADVRRHVRQCIPDFDALQAANRTADEMVKQPTNMMHTFASFGSFVEDDSLSYEGDGVADKYGCRLCATRFEYAEGADLNALGRARRHVRTAHEDQYAAAIADPARHPDKVFFGAFGSNMIDQHIEQVDRPEGAEGVTPVDRFKCRFCEKVCWVDDLVELRRHVATRHAVNAGDAKQADAGLALDMIFASPPRPTSIFDELTLNTIEGPPALTPPVIGVDRGVPGGDVATIAVRVSKLREKSEGVCHAQFDDGAGKVIEVRPIDGECRHVVVNGAVVDERALPYMATDVDRKVIKNFSLDPPAYRCDVCGVARFTVLQNARDHVRACDGEPPKAAERPAASRASVARRLAELSIASGNPAAPVFHQKCGDHFRDLRQALEHDCRAEDLSDDERVLHVGKHLADRSARERERLSLRAAVSEVGRYATHARQAVDDVFERLAAITALLDEEERVQHDADDAFDRRVASIEEGRFKR